MRAASFIISALVGKSVKPELLSYENTFGVGYAVSAFEVISEDKNRQSIKFISETKEKSF